MRFRPVPVNNSGAPPGSRNNGTPLGVLPKGWSAGVPQQPGTHNFRIKFFGFWVIEPAAAETAALPLNPAAGAKSSTNCPSFM
jgi:hypothetical protein